MKMINCYKCNIELDTGSRYDKLTCIVFSDNIKKVHNILDKELCKHSDESIEHISIEKIDPKEGLVIKIK